MTQLPQAAAQPAEVPLTLLVPYGLVLTTLSDSGPSHTDNYTNVLKPAVTGFGTPGSSVTLYEGSLPLGSSSVDADGSWSIQTSSQPGEGLHTYRAIANMGTGSRSGPSLPLVITIDRSAPAQAAAPDLSSLSDSANPGDNITNAADLVFGGAGEPGATVNLYANGIAIAAGKVDALGNWTVNAGGLADGQNILFSIDQVDLAGNVSVLRSPSLAVTIDRQAPAAPAIPQLLANDDSGLFNTDGITALSTPKLIGSAEANARVDVYDGLIQLGSTTADSLGAWSFQTAPLSEGPHALSARATDAAGNSGAASAQLQVRIDTQISAATTIDLATASDSGSSNSDRLTRVNTPTLSGSAEAGALLALFDGGQQIGNASADASGAWSFTTGVLADGIHHLTVGTSDLAGNVLAPVALDIEIDTQLAQPGKPDLLTTSDGGVSTSDDYTNDNTPSLSGLSEALAAIAVYDGETLIGNSAADANGVWTLTTGALGEGQHPITARARDAAGNDAIASDVLLITVDTIALSAPATAPDLSYKFDSGKFNYDNLTNAQLAAFSGTGLASTTVVLFADGQEIGRGLSNASGQWNIDSTVALADGVRDITTRYMDMAGNLSPDSPKLPVTIDTVSAKPAAPNMVSTSDTGSNDDNITSTMQPVYDGVAEAGATVNLYADGTLIATKTADAAGLWSATATALSAGQHQMTVQVTDLAGNASAMSDQLSVTLDASAPAAPSALDLLDLADSGRSRTDNITNIATPTIGGKAEAGSSVELFNGLTSLGKGTADANGDWQITSLVSLPNGPTTTLKAYATDAAGNKSAAGQIVFNIDLLTPGTPTALDLAPASDSGSSNTDNLSNNTRPTISGTAPVDSLLITLFDGGTQIGSTLAGANGAWTITSDVTLTGEGKHALSATATDVAGNISILSSQLNIMLDTIADPAPSQPDLRIDSDSGLSNADNITSVTAPVFTGIATAGSLVKLYDGEVLRGSATTDASGKWTITSSALTAGSHDMTARIVDLADNWAKSEPLRVVIDTTAPVAPAAPDLLVDSDHGFSNTDNNTNVKQPTFGGQAEAFAEVFLYDNGVAVGSASADAGGAWKITSNVMLSDSTHSMTVKAKDAAGNLSAASAALSVIVNGAAIAKPAALDLTTASDKGILTTDNITSVSKPIISGSAKVGSTVTLYSDGGEIGKAVTDAAGKWTITSTSVLSDSQHSITAVASDVAGNVSPVSDALTITIDTTLPVAASRPVIEAASDTGQFNYDSVTKIKTPILTGTAEAGILVELYEGAVKVGFGNADAQGNWSIATTALTSGPHTIYASSKDLAGNLSSSAPLTLTIDFTVPVASIADLGTAEDTGKLNTDNITKINLPTLSGTTEANARVDVYDNGTQISTVYANAAGAWKYLPASALGDGTHSITTIATDLAGNASVLSAPLPLKIDTQVTAPSAPDLTSDTGASGSDNITDAATQSFKGSGAEPGASIRLYANGTLISGAAGTANANGDWTASVSLAPGNHIQFSAVQTDLAGNASAASGTLDVTILPPPDVDDPTEVGNDSGTVLEDNIFTVSKATLLANDYDPDTALSIASVKALVGGPVVFDAGGNIKFTPLANFYGKAQFSYTLNTGNVGYVTVDVTQVDDARNYVNDIQKLYVAVFNRPADVQGLANTLQLFNDPVHPRTIYEHLDFMATTPEFHAIYDTLTNSQMVDRIYQNLFDRSPLPGENFWVGKLDDGSISRARIFIEIFNGAQLSDIGKEVSKVMAAEYFTHYMDTSAEVAGYSGAGALAQANLYMDSLRDDATLFQARLDVHSWIQRATGAPLGTQLVAPVNAQAAPDNTADANHVDAVLTGNAAAPMENLW
ncbi:cadherin-like domain-containing protein [Oxalobacteraceae bacterium]|nr:cadherin-like domain-containing protein [Oxalobacteraceae bacterium]